MLLDENVKNMFVVENVKMTSPIKYYNIRLKCKLTTKHDADQICKDLNELILKYLDCELEGKKK